MRSFVGWLWCLGKPSSPVPVLALGAAWMFFFQLHREIHDVDIFWQVKLGELTLKAGLPEHEPFLAGKDTEPLAAVAWLGQVVYAIIKLIGGWPLLRLADAAIWFAAFYLVARQCAKQIGNDWPALIGLGVGYLAAIPHASLRPQSLALLGFAILIVIHRGQLSTTRKFILTALLVVLWQNLHPSVIIAIGYLGAHAAVGWLRQRDGKPWALTALTLVAIASTVLTPAGFKIFAISKYNEEISKERGITEWQPMWWSPLDYGRENAWLGLHFLLVLAAFLIVARIVTGRCRVRAADALVVFGLTALSLYMHRFIIFWGVAVIPLFADGLMIPTAMVPRNRWRSLVAGLALCLAVLPPMIVHPAPFADYYPFPAVQALKAGEFRGTIYCNYFWGGIVAEAGHPDWKVTHDGRYYLFTRDEWQLYNRTMAGGVPLEQIIDRHHPDAFVLYKGHDDGLIARLRGEWPVFFEDKQSIIFRRD